MAPGSIYNRYKDKSLSLIVPFYKESEKVKESIKSLNDELEQYFLNYEIIAVADNGKDETYYRILELKDTYPKLKVCEYGCNQGKGFAVKHGFENSKGDYVVFIDGGMEIHPKHIKAFFGLMDIYDADIIVGSKRHPQSEVNYPNSRKILSWLYQLFIRIFLNLNIKDTQAGLKLFKREVLEKSFPRVLVKKYAFDPELLTVANYLGYRKILEAPIRIDYVNSEKKRFWPKDFIHTLKITWPMLVDTLSIIYRLRFLKYYDRIPTKGIDHHTS